MTKQKRSFLDKIVGAGSGDNKEVNMADENEMNNSENAEENVLGGIDNNDSLQDADENVYKKKEADKEWFPEGEAKTDEEGQLTVDVYKTENFIVIKSIIGGVRPEDLDVSITSDMVTVKGKRNNPDDVAPDDYYYQECFWGPFSRSIILPCDIKTEGVEASIKNGILTVKLPMIEKNSSMKIEVKSE
jgi:HSP20 family molecular chaperone IbpA